MRVLSCTGFHFVEKARALLQSFRTRGCGIAELFFRLQDGHEMLVYQNISSAFPGVNGNMVDIKQHLSLRSKIVIMNSLQIFLML